MIPESIQRKMSALRAHAACDGPEADNARRILVELEAKYLQDKYALADGTYSNDVSDSASIYGNHPDRMALVEDQLASDIASLEQLFMQSSDDPVLQQSLWALLCQVRHRLQMLHKQREQEALERARSLAKPVKAKQAKKNIRRALGAFDENAEQLALPLTGTSQNTAK